MTVNQPYGSGPTVRDIYDLGLQTLLNQPQPWESRGFAQDQPSIIMGRALPENLFADAAAKYEAAIAPLPASSWNPTVRGGPGEPMSKQLADEIFLSPARATFGIQEPQVAPQPRPRNESGRYVPHVLPDGTMVVTDTWTGTTADSGQGTRKPEKEVAAPVPWILDEDGKVTKWKEYTPSQVRQLIKEGRLPEAAKKSAWVKAIIDELETQSLPAPTGDFFPSQSATPMSPFTSTPFSPSLLQPGSPFSPPVISTNAPVRRARVVKIESVR